MSAALRTATQSQIKDSVTASTPELNELGGQSGKFRRNSLRLRQAMHGQGSISGSGDERSRAADALRSDRIPDMRRHHANRHRRHIQFFVAHVVDLRRGFESAPAIAAERLFEPTVNAGVL